MEYRSTRGGQGHAEYRVHTGYHKIMADADGFLAHPLGRDADRREQGPSRRPRARHAEIARGACCAGHARCARRAQRGPSRHALLSGNAPYDRYKAGDEDALSEAAQRGMVVFFNARCHFVLAATVDNNGILSAHAF